MSSEVQFSLFFNKYQKNSFHFCADTYLNSDIYKYAFIIKPMTSKVFFSKLNKNKLTDIMNTEIIQEDNKEKKNK